MNIFKRKSSRRLRHAFRSTPGGGTIWKLQPTVSGILAGEVRDTEAKQVTFFGMNLKDGSFAFTNLRLEEPWWTALELVIGNTAIIHRFPKPDMPRSLGATAVDCSTGTVLWQSEVHKILCGTHDIALAQLGESHGEPDLVFLDVQSGNTIERIGDDMARAEEFYALCANDPRWDGWVPASELTDDIPGAASMTQAITSKAGEQRGSAEYARVGTYTVLSAHTRSSNSANAMLGNKLNNVVMVLDKDMNVVFSETIAADITGINSDTFFIRDGVLIFISHGTTLTGVSLKD